MDQQRHEQELIAYVSPKLQAIEGLTIIPKTSPTFWCHFSLIEISIRMILATALDSEGIAVQQVTTVHNRLFTYKPSDNESKFLYLQHQSGL